MAFLFFLLRVLIRRDRVAAAAFLLIGGTAQFLSRAGIVEWVGAFLIFAVLVAVLVRFGLLAFAAAMVAANLVVALPPTTHLSAWYAGTSFAGLALLLGLAGYAFYISLGGQPMFGRVSIEE